ncbi:MAG: redoxin domain-containing protein [Lachnospiraceae bacterium]|nr:redoxin domain-containing protein [Lachnospiraceae bacterium]
MKNSIILTVLAICLLLFGGCSLLEELVIPETTAQVQAEGIAEPSLAEPVPAEATPAPAEPSPAGTPIDPPVIEITKGSTPEAVIDLPVGINIGEIAPDFTLEMRGGGSVTLGDLRGKPTIINVSASWCPPCKWEFPEIQRVYEDYHELVNIIVISYWETKAEADAYFDNFAYQFPIAYAPNDELDPDYQIEFIPQSWILDANGVIVDYIPGATEYDEFVFLIKKAFNQ